MQEIAEQVKAAKDRLAEVTEAMDNENMDMGSLDEALDALDDTMDIIADFLEEEK